MADACCVPLSSLHSSLLLPPTASSALIRIRSSIGLKSGREGASNGSRRMVCGFLPMDAWAPTIDSESIAPQLFAVSLFPYLGFLYFLTKSKTAPKLTLFGLYFLLTFVGATIPAEIYAKVYYEISLSNVDWLHGGAESLLTLTNLFIVLGLRDALRRINDAKKGTPEADVTVVKEKQSSA